MSSLLKNLLIALGIAILLWIGYMTFLNVDTDEPLSASTGTVTEQAKLETQQLLLDIQRLNTFSIGGDIFDDARFTSLRDFRVDIPPENVGRPNPFAPLTNPR
jgi:hypothetical protein